MGDVRVGLSLGPDGDILVADGLSVATVGAGRASAAGTVRRLLTLLLELHTLAIGVCPLGGDLAVLAISGQILLYGSGVSQPSVLVDGLDEPTSVVGEDANTLLVTERGRGRITRVRRDGQRHVLASGLHRPGAAGLGADATVWVSQGGGSPVLELGPDGSVRRQISGFTDAQGVAVSGRSLLVADVGARRLVAVDTASGARRTVVEAARIGPPTVGPVPAAFCSLCSDGADGFYVGGNGDGSIRRLRPGR